MNTAEVPNKDIYTSVQFQNLPAAETVRLTPKPFYSCMKRFLDIALSIAGIIVFALPMFIIGILIRLDSPGKAIFKQERLGKNGKPFILYKFRTMCLDAEKDGPVWATRQDSRCTKIGRFLRMARLDELMQLFNILKGDMSFVGPRPERAVFYEEFEQYIPGFTQRLCVVPGLTGLAQINGGYDLKPEQKIVWDLQYIEKRSLLLDFKIVRRTVVIVFSHKGAR